MSTYGMVTIYEGDEAVLQAVARCNGMHAKQAADDLQRHWPLTPQAAYDLIIGYFGCPRCLAVYTATEAVGTPEGTPEEMFPYTVTEATVSVPRAKEGQ